MTGALWWLGSHKISYTLLCRYHTQKKDIIFLYYPYRKQYSHGSFPKWGSIRDARRGCLGIVGGFRRSDRGKFEKGPHKRFNAERSCSFFRRSAQLLAQGAANLWSLEGPRNDQTKNCRRMQWKTFCTPSKRNTFP